MAKTDKLSAVKGMNDILPGESARWEWLEAQVRDLMGRFAYRNIRTPIVEPTALFVRGLGEVTDIVEKEMYSFEDKLNGEHLTLRPEGTAGVVRSVVENNLLYEGGKRLFYIGQMFRHERPQRGRYRQFHQVGVEAMGFAGPELDAEVILLAAQLWKELGIEGVRLELNSLGQPEERKAHRAALIAYFEQHTEVMDEEAKRRMYSNPLRVLDSKNPEVQALLNDAPRLSEYLDEESRAHFAGLCELLAQAGIPYTVNERLVRGLDYYNRTVFEWVTTSLGAQGTVCAGGRYDGLVEQLGGRATPAVGFAMGLERLVLLVQAVNPEFKAPSAIDVYVISSGAGTQSAAMQLAEQVRDAAPQLKLMTNYGGGNFKKQITRADKWGARIALILGESEVAAQQVVVKDLRSGEQETLAQSEVAARLALMLG